MAQAIVRDGERHQIHHRRRGRRQDRRRMPPGGLRRRPFAAHQDRLLRLHPNLGRILAAIGYAGIDDLDVDGIRVWLDVLVAERAAAPPPTGKKTGRG